VLGIADFAKNPRVSERTSANRDLVTAVTMQFFASVQLSMSPFPQRITLFPALSIASRTSDPEHFTPPTKDEIIELSVKFVEDVVKLKGEEVGIRESRSRAAYFIRGNARLSLSP